MDFKEHPPKDNVVNECLSNDCYIENDFATIFSESMEVLEGDDSFNFSYSSSSNNHLISQESLSSFGNAVKNVNLNDPNNSLSLYEEKTILTLSNNVFLVPTVCKPQTEFQISDVVNEIENKTGGCSIYLEDIDTNITNKNHDNQSSDNAVDFTQIYKEQNFDFLHEKVTVDFKTSAKIHVDEQETVGLGSVGQVNEKPSTVKRVCISSEKLTRKRKINQNNWEQYKIKKALNSGMSYESRYNKIQVNAREMKESCGINCRFKCDVKINESERKNIFKTFWKIGEHSKQWDFIIRHVLEKKPENFNDLKKKFSRKYFFKISDRQIFVCKTMFLNTLGISHSWIDTALIKSQNNTVIDKRGTSTNRPRTISEEIKNTVRDHINKFPKVESHYTRKDTKREYLDQNLNISLMYRLYIKSSNENYQKYTATERQYRDIFNREFNLSFIKPKKDRCNLCEEYKNLSNDRKKKIINDYKEHIDNKIAVRNLKARDAKMSKNINSKNICVACFDFEKILQTPKAEINLLYYKRKLSVFNFTVYDIGRHEGTCYVWPENLAKKGSTEVASCLLYYIERKSSNGVTDFIFYSDNCAGQNRNKFVFSMYVFARAKYCVNIIHRFLEKGHTQNEGDSIHAAIERKSSNSDIFVPEEWYNIIISAKKMNPYKIIKVNQGMVFNFKELAKILNWGKNSRNQKIYLSKIREISIQLTAQNAVEYKTSFSLLPEILRIINENSFDIAKYELKKNYLSDLGIPKKKLTDLLVLCSKNIIPNNHHKFYRTLNATKDIKDSNNNSSESEIE